MLLESAVIAAQDLGLKRTCEFDNFFLAVSLTARGTTKCREKGLILESDPGPELHAVRVSVYCFPMSFAVHVVLNHNKLLCCRSQVYLSTDPRDPISPLVSHSPASPAGV